MRDSLKRPENNTNEAIVDDVEIIVTECVNKNSEHIFDSAVINTDVAVMDSQNTEGTNAVDFGDKAVHDKLENILGSNPFRSECRRKGCLSC